MFTFDNHYLTTRELAALLRIKERKVYELVASGEVPCSRATGKLLFPSLEIQAWIARHGSGFFPRSTTPLANVALGSHDPLLDWAIRESGCGLATYYDGSTDGLARFFDRKGIMTGLHLLDLATETWNTPFVVSGSSLSGCNNVQAVLVEFSWRERGIMLAKGNPRNITSLSDLVPWGIATRQAGSGAQVLFELELQRRGLDISQLRQVCLARTETDAASAIAASEADAAFGLRSVAHQHQLDFISISRERFDLLVDRRSWFEPEFQTLGISEKRGFYQEIVDLARIRLFSAWHNPF